MIAHRRSRLAHGFTLVEVLVVISIIALLIAILIPTLSAAKKQASGVVCQSNMRQLMGGMLLYVTDDGAFPGTHSLFFFQSLFDQSWPRPAGVTWDGARDQINDNLSYTVPYTRPFHLDEAFISDVPRRGTLFPYINDERVYRCPTDRPGPAQDSPEGGGGNGRLSYGFNAYLGYRSPDSLRSFRFVADSLDNELPGGQETRSFRAGQVVNFSAARFVTMVEEHPKANINGDFPDGNFNGIDRVATRHQIAPGAEGREPTGRVSMAYLDGHVASPSYPSRTLGRQIFTEFGQPHMWRNAGGPDKANMSAFIPRLSGPSPW